MRKGIGLLVLVVGVVGMLFGSAWGESYTNGSEGIKCGSVPPPGLYYKMFNGFVTSDKLVDTDGDEIPIGFDLTVFANVHRFVWVTKHKILGGDYTVSCLIPIVYTDIKIDAAQVDDDTVGLGDIILEPFILAWHGSRWDSAFGFSLFVPTGAHEDPADPGEDMYTLMTTVGYTYYMDEPKTWSASILARYEMHGEQDETEVTPGDDFHFEWGIGKGLQNFWEVGLVGWFQWQVSDDDPKPASNDKESAYAVGPEVTKFFPAQKCQLSLKVTVDVDVDGGSDGRAETTRTFLNFTKIL